MKMKRQQNNARSNGGSKQKQIYVPVPPKNSSITISRIPPPPPVPASAPKKRAVTQRNQRARWVQRSDNTWRRITSGQPSENILQSGVSPTTGINRNVVARSSDFSGTSEKLMLDDCSLDFIKARFTPWASFKTPPCNPVRTPVQSIKIRTRITGLAGADAGGNAWVVVNPYNVNNDERQVNTSIIGAPAINPGNLYETAFGQFFAWTESPFNTGDQCDFKIVGCAIQMCDIGQVFLAQVSSHGLIIPLIRLS